MFRVRDGQQRIVYARSKIGVEADLQLLAELEEALAHLPGDQQLFLPKHGSKEPYKVASFGNWVHDRCAEAGARGSVQGPCKAAATRPALAGTTENDIGSLSRPYGHETGIDPHQGYEQTDTGR